MTLLIFMIGAAAAMAAIVGYVAWRDRRGQGSFVDPSISRSALVQAQWQAVLPRMAPDALVVKLVDPRSGSQSRANRR
ncbi:hypothetical protein AB0M20_02840 [Actinoplanes sp. NPDC051633]|uniref:hypothetical protein n=1 Tax=Actinoplanes sp. NPDC051633 TaxID=3155670 RepID=UPI00342A8185